MNDTWLPVVAGLGGVILGWRLEARGIRRWREEDVTREAAVRFLTLGYELTNLVYSWTRSEHWDQAAGPRIVPESLKADERRVHVLYEEMFVWAVVLQQSGRPGTGTVAFGVRAELDEGLLDDFGRLSNGYGGDKDEFGRDYLRASSALTGAADILTITPPWRVRVWRRLRARIWLWNLERRRRSEARGGLDSGPPPKDSPPSEDADS